MKKINYFLFIILAFSSCKKEVSLTPVTQILVNHEWYLYQIQTNTYDSASSGWVFKNSVTNNSSGCDVTSKYKFLQDNIFTLNSTCLNMAGSSGKWSLSSDSTLNAAIPQSFNGQTYYIGITGHLSAINDTQFNTKSFFISYSSYPSIHKDSTVTINIYKN